MITHERHLLAVAFSTVSDHRMKPFPGPLLASETEAMEGVLKGAMEGVSMVVITGVRMVATKPRSALLLMV